MIAAYRIGVYGFFDAGAPTADAPYNVGLLDILAALDWLRVEGGAFGADTSRITAMGNSAGGSALIDLLVSPATPPNAFAQAIISSATIDFSPHAARPLSKLLIERTNVRCHKFFFCSFVLQTSLFLFSVIATKRSPHKSSACGGFPPTI